MVIRGKDAIHGLNPATDDDMIIHLRKNGDALMDISAKWPLLLRDPVDRVSAPTWLWPDGRVAFRPTTWTSGLTWDEAGVRGDALIRTNHHYETWEFDLKAEGDVLKGSYVHRALPLAESIAIDRGIYGNVSTNEDGSKVWSMSASGIMAKAGNLRKALAEGTDLPNVAIVLTLTEDGSIRQAWAGAGRVNTHPGKWTSAISKSSMTNFKAICTSSLGTIAISISTMICHRSRIVR